MFSQLCGIGGCLSVCVCLPWRCLGRHHPPSPRLPLPRSVRILLECILVMNQASRCKALFTRNVCIFVCVSKVTKMYVYVNKWWCSHLGFVYSGHQRQDCDNTAMLVAILVSLKTMLYLQNRFRPHSEATPLFSMRTGLLASSQHLCFHEQDNKHRRYA